MVVQGHLSGGRQEGAPFLSGEGGCGSSQAPSRLPWGGVANSVGGVVYARMWGVAVPSHCV